MYQNYLRISAAWLCVAFLTLGSISTLRAQDLSKTGTGIGTLPGSGTSGGSSPIALGNMGTLYPTNLNLQAGKVYDTTSLTPSPVDTNLTFGVGNTLDLLMDSSTLAVSTLDVTGTLELKDVNLVITDIATTPESIPVGTVFDLIKYSGASPGEFTVDGSLIPEGGTFLADGDVFEPNYAVGDPEITLTDLAVAPEPSTWIMFAGALGLLGCYRRFTIAKKATTSTPPAGS